MCFDDADSSIYGDMTTPVDDMGHSGGKDINNAYGSPRKEDADSRAEKDAKDKGGDCTEAGHSTQ